MTYFFAWCQSRTREQAAKVRRFRDYACIASTLAIFGLGLPGRAQDASTPSAVFERDIQHVLKSRCYACHGALKQESGLRVDTVQAMQDAGIITSGEPDHSELLSRISTQDATRRMPPIGAPLTPDQIEAIGRWIARGATPPANDVPEADPKEHWAFRNPVRPSVPSLVSDLDRTANPIDAFLLDSMHRSGCEPRPMADRATRLRRLMLDLVGVPPTCDEQISFLADESKDAYEQVVARLLSSPQHGERWGRHWMDVWRYADWFGRRSVPDVWNSAPQIWRWRDWIVQSLNDNKGYDQMIREMIAADEVCPEDTSASVATGYLIRNWYALNPNDWMRNVVEHTSKAFLGLTVQCAHCHDHKYDPISQEEYFQFRAFFEPMYVRQDRIVGQPDPGLFQDYQYSTQRKVQRFGLVRVFDMHPDATTWFYTGGDERNRLADRGSIPPGVPTFLKEALDSPIDSIELPPQAWYPGLRPEIQQTMEGELLVALQAAQQDLESARSVAERRELRVAAANARVAAVESQIADLHARFAAERVRYEPTSVTSAEDRSRLARVASQAQRTMTKLIAELSVRLAEYELAEAEAKPDSEPEREKQVAAIKERLSNANTQWTALQSQSEDANSEDYAPLTHQYPRTSTGRRRAFANWLTSRRNPLTARVAVNHIWMRHFHKPLVASVFDFGRNGTPPTHPDLLDWLACELMDSDWDMKRIHTLIVTSDAYQRESSVGDSRSATIDPENRLLWRMNTGRMEAEVLRDSILHLARQLDNKHGGQELENSQSLTTFRRSLYYCCQPEDDGKSPLGLLFDGPDATECYRRSRTVVPQQSLALTNSDWIHEISGSIHRQLIVASASETLNNREFVERCFRWILNRTPLENEIAVCELFLNESSESQRTALIRILLNHNDFITIR